MAKWLRKNWINIILFAIVLAGLCLLLYPTFSDWWNSQRQSQAIAAYVEQVDDLSPEEIEKLIGEARAYNERLWENENRLLFTPEEKEEYLSMLDVTGTGIMGYVNIPAIGVNLPIYHGTDESVLQVAIGHLEGTSLPVGGEGVHTVISGHRGLPSARLFTDLDRLEIGDVFTLSVLNEVYTYQIDQIRTVVPQDTSELRLYEGEDLCTLQTCTPYGVNSHRLLLRGRRVDNLEDGPVVTTSEAVRVPNYLVIPAVGVPLLFLLLLAALIYFRRRRPKLTEEDLKSPFKKD